MGQDGERNTMPLAQAWPKRRQRVRSTEEHYVGLEVGDLPIHPLGDCSGRPHEPPPPTANYLLAGHRLGRSVCGREHSHRIRIGVDQVSQVLLNAARSWRVIVRDEQETHDAYQGAGATLYSASIGPRSQYTTRDIAVLLMLFTCIRRS